MVFVRILLFVLFTAVGFPLVGVLTGGLAFLTVAATTIGPLLIGALIGGVLVRSVPPGLEGWNAGLLE